ncbi:hypothetical protein EsDP_00001063 [Epichloe bromicola]|uniref:Uncharacterized protein n=1 Tax=Epichloe bromicola TaxID=79588 RepID=A0ABQ0CGQ6_9HYPO
MSSLQRTRSLRKPTKPLTAEPAASTAHPSRSASPSRLPVKPSTRPTSVYAPVLGRSTSLSKKQKAPAAQDAVKKESRHPPLSSAHRPASVVVKTRPTSAGGGSGSAPPTRGPSASHIRAKSTVTSLSAATALRPPSRERSGGATSTSAKTVRGRSASADKGPSTPVGKQHTTITPSASAAAEAAKPRLRPAFSTLQQHYSPAKAHNPKPLTSAILAPPSPSRLPANIAASAETSRLQAELVQLHLLHRDARAVQSQWQASAKQKLGARFDKLSRESACIAAREASALEGDNVLALRQWARSGRNIEDKMQALDEIMTNLWTLSEPAGRHARIVRRFERFVDGVRDAEEARQSTEKTKTALTSHDVLFIGELDDSWREEVAALTRRLEAWREQLSSIDDFDSGSPDSDSGRGGACKPSLEKMLSGARELISGMLAELYAMGEIEQQALAREHAWVESMNKEGDDELELDTPRAGAVWRVL